MGTVRTVSAGLTGAAAGAGVPTYVVQLKVHSVWVCEHIQGHGAQGTAAQAASSGASESNTTSRPRPARKKGHARLVHALPPSRR